ncbi:MAG: HAMP domain-containing histidine kinase [Lachnospiraceae bacterium]|nr:HAMP domain-containing histidine kinase [Lachnospiraceae bacterium]
MEGNKKKIINKKTAKNITAVLSQFFAMTMAAILVILAMRYIVLHENYGSYIISPYEKYEDFQDTQTFQSVFQRELMELSHYMALCSQLETEGEYDSDRKVDVFEYVNRRNTDTINTHDYPKLVYRVGDLIEWSEYGIGWGEQELSYDEAKDYLTEEEMKTQLAQDSAVPVDEMDDTTASMNEDMLLKQYNYVYTFVDEEFKPQNVKSVYDLELPDGVSMTDVINAINQTSGDLQINYDEYLKKKKQFGPDNNFKYMFVDKQGQILYTNLENRENYSADELKEAFTACKTYLIYDYATNELRSNNLLVDQEAYYKLYFRNYNYCFPNGGTVYAAIQTKSSGAFGPFDSGDFYAVTDANLSKVNASWEQMLGFAVVFGVLAIVSLIAFIVLQPKKKKEELVYFDSWFTEFAVALAATTTCAIIGIGAYFATLCVEHSLFRNMTVEQYNRGFLFSIYVTFAILYVTFLLYLGSLVRRIKAKALWKGTFCYYLLHNTKKICGRIMSLIRKVVEELVNNKSFIVRTFGPYFMFLLINVTLVLALREFGVVLAVVFDVAVMVYLYYENKAREEIVAGITRICDGDVEFQIDTKRFYGENKVIADSVNKIGEAVKTAVQISMKDERLKADLITNVSHDIKTPLTSIINYVDLLKRENIENEKAQEYIRILDEKSQRLKQLTLDLVEASKISSGNITLEMNDINVKELLKQAVGEYKDKMEEKNLVIIESYPEENSPMIYADSGRMWRVVENLLVNIYKYSLEGTRVYVDVAKVKDLRRPAEKDDIISSDIVTDSSAHQELVEITFKNISAQPLNIPAEELTERFIRGDISRSTEGSGLGLSIAQNLTVAQGGEFKIYLDGDLFKVVMRFPGK